jgi:uncharacterized protein
MSPATPQYAPDFSVSFAGSPMPAPMRASVTNLVLQSGFDGADRVELTLNNDNLRWMDDPLLALDKPLTLSMGYASAPLQQMFVGNIVSLSPTFPSDGSPTLTVAAQDKREQLQQGSNVQWFGIPTSTGNYPMPDPAVAAIVAGENLLIPMLEPIGAAIAVLISGVQIAVGVGAPDEAQRIIRRQSGTSDYEFLRTIARENGWELVIDHDGPQGGRVLRFFSLLDHLQPDVTLSYGETLIEFNPRITNVGQILEVSATIWQPSLKIEVTVTVGWDWDRQSLSLRITPGLSEAAPRSATAASLTLAGEPINVLTAPRVILGKLLPSLNGRLTGSGSTVGDPRIRTGVVLQLDGLGSQFGGLHRVTSVTHTIGSGGYRTQFDTRKEIWFGSIPGPPPGSLPLRVQGQSIS